MKFHLKKFLFFILSFGLNTLYAQTFEWAKSFGGTLYDAGPSVTIDTSGNIYTTGTFEGIVDFDLGVGILDLTSVGGRDAFVQKMDANGDFLWAKSSGGTGNLEAGLQIIVDAYGNVYSTGYFDGMAYFDSVVGIYNLSSAGDFDVFVQKMDANGNLLWAKSFGGTSYDNGTSIGLDKFGNVYTTGLFQGTADFDPGVGIFNLTSAGDGDVFVQKMDANGNFIWAKSFGGTGTDYVFSIAVDTTGHIYTTGYFDDTSDFDPGTGIFNLASAGNDDVFVQKMDDNGNFLWAKSFGGNSYDRGNSVALDAAGNVYVKGYFAGTVDFDSGVGTYNLTSAGINETFIQKMDTNGNFIWAKSFGATSNLNGIVQSMALDVMGNVYSTGNFEGTADFDPGVGIVNLTSLGNSDVFVQKMDVNGNFIWAKSFGGTGYDYGGQIAVDDSENVYTIGNFDGVVDFDPGAGIYSLSSAGNGDIFVQKMSQPNTAIKELINGITITAYPNPSASTVHISFSKTMYQVNFILTDILGKVVSENNYSTFSNAAIELPAVKGLYFLNIATQDAQKTLKLIKE
jgi:hypothetical protein